MPNFRLIDVLTIFIVVDPLLIRYLSIVQMIVQCKIYTVKNYNNI